MTALIFVQGKEPFSCGLLVFAFMDFPVLVGVGFPNPSIRVGLFIGLHLFFRHDAVPVLVQKVKRRA